MQRRNGVTSRNAAVQAPGQKGRKVMTYIKDFDQLGRSDVDEAGGKGANLGELARAGFPVPPGFVLTTPAYQDFVNANGIAGRILQLAALPAAALNDDYEAAARQIHSLFAESTMPEEIGAELRAAYGRLSRQAADLGEEDGAESSGDYAARVAVRSSATAEDLASASFAGQQDTYLNVAGDDAVVAAVINCWASLWNARAMAYRARNGVRSVHGAPRGGGPGDGRRRGRRRAVHRQPRYRPPRRDSDQRRLGAG